MFFCFLGIEPPDVRNKIKSQIIKDLAIDRKNFKEKKPFVSFPYLFKPHREKVYCNSNIEKKNSPTDVSNIGTFLFSKFTL